MSTVVVCPRGEPVVSSARLSPAYMGSLVATVIATLVAGPMAAQATAPSLPPASARDWRPLLTPSLAQWEVFTGVPHPSVKPHRAGRVRATSEPSGQPVGLGDPYRLFTVRRDPRGELVLHVSGQVYGGLTTRASFANYHLTFEVRWGQRRWPPRLTEKRDSGLLYHCREPHGAFWNVWMRCLELQVQEGDMGDLHQLAGPNSEVRQSDATWNPTGPLVRSATRVKRRRNTESPLGAWTRVDLYVVGDRAVHVVNGAVVLALQSARTADGQPLTSGKLQVQSEGAECWYRDIRWRPIRRLPPAVAREAGFARS
jgi:hypothetical protein